MDRSTDLSSHNAMRVLGTSGFPINSKWDVLASHLGVPLDKRNGFKQVALFDGGNFHHALEECIDWWIRNQSATWKHLIESVEKVGDMRSASRMIEYLENEGPAFNSSVKTYIERVRDRYANQPIIQSEWPPPVGNDYFAKLALIKSQGYSCEVETMRQKSWMMMRGRVDLIPDIAPQKEIDIQDILMPNSENQPLRVVVDGPPGIGKTTVCHKLCKMWSTDQLSCKKYELMFFCALRKESIANARSLGDFFFKGKGQQETIEWIQERDGRGVVFIFDGWDELSDEGKKQSLASKIIQGDCLYHCSAMVTSRTYASYSLLECPLVNRHVEILGLKPTEIEDCIIGTLKSSPELAHKLIDELEARDDIYSICYVPMLCSMVILVFTICGHTLPSTVTSLYEKFIYETIKRHLKKLKSPLFRLMHAHCLESLPPPISDWFSELCQFALNSMTKIPPKMSFTEADLVAAMLSKDNQYLGFMTSISAYHTDYNQFLHLTIQEFLAAWMLFKLNDSGVSICIDHFEEKHFHMTVRFFAGLTQLKSPRFNKYFSESADLHCWKDPLFGFYGYQSSTFHKQKESILWIELAQLSENHVKSTQDPLFTHRDHLNFHTLHLLYESQNTELCKLYAKSVINSSICLRKTPSHLTPFDALTFGYFISQSEVSWNYIDLGTGASAHPFVDHLQNCVERTKCKAIEIALSSESHESLDFHSVIELFRGTFLNMLSECYLVITSEYVGELHHAAELILAIFTLEKLQVFHFVILWNRTKQIGKYKQLCSSFARRVEQAVQAHSCLHEFLVKVNVDVVINPLPEVFFNDLQIMVGCIIQGVAKSLTVRSFSLMLDQNLVSSFVSEAVRKLFSENETILSLQLDLPTSITELLQKVCFLSTSLTALYYKTGFASIPTHPALNFLALGQPVSSTYLTTLSCLSIQNLSICVDSVDHCVQLFTIVDEYLKLKTLRVKFLNQCIVGDIKVSESTKQTLENNKTLHCLEIVSKKAVSTTYFEYTTKGLMRNNSIRELSIDIPFNGKNGTVVEDFFERALQLTELKIDILLDVKDFDVHMTQSVKDTKLLHLFYSFCLPLFTKMLLSNQNLQYFKVLCMCLERNLSDDTWKKSIENFWEAILVHESLIFIKVPVLKMLLDVFSERKDNLLLKRRERTLSTPPKIYFALLW